jgi:nucleotide-binding universal stress UspA family protein
MAHGVGDGEFMHGRWRRMTATPYKPALETLDVLATAQYRETRYSRLFAPIPIRQIMVPLSGVSLSECALPYALTMAEATGAGISLVFVESREDGPEGGALSSKPLDYLAGIRAKLGLSAPRVQTRVMRAATVVRGCTDAEYTDSTDLVVLATHSPTDDSQHAIGRLASEMIRHSQAPVLLIPPNAPPPPPSMRALVLLDGSGQAEYTLFPIVALSNASRGHFIGEITLLIPCEEHKAMTAATSYMEEIRTSMERLVAPKVHIHAEVVHGRAPRAIVEHLREHAGPRFDLLAMTTYGKGYDGDTLLGPVAGHALTRVHLPMLIVNPRFR